MIFNVEVNVEGENGGSEPVPAFAASGTSTRAGRVSYSGGQSPAGAGALAAAAAAAGASAQEYGEEGEPIEAMPVVEQRVVDEEHQVGRNDPCWCGSGKKFKKCHGA
jgi:preprotein translocase subunit SecA